MLEKLELIGKILLTMPIILPFIGGYIISTDRLNFFRKLWVYWITAFYGVSIVLLWV